MATKLRSQLKQLEERLKKERETIIAISPVMIYVIGDRKNYYSILRRIQTLKKRLYLQVPYEIISKQEMMKEYHEFKKLEETDLIVSFTEKENEKDQVKIGYAYQVPFSVYMFLEIANRILSEEDYIHEQKEYYDTYLSLAILRSCRK